MEWRPLLPPLLYEALVRAKGRRMLKWRKVSMVQDRPDKRKGDPQEQDLDLYWDSEFARVLDTWGDGNVWHEILFIMAACRGKILDIACGTGKTIEIVQRCFPLLDVHGCDISNLLIGQAQRRGIAAEKLKVCDATHTGYADLAFDHAYSIGSLEHFTQSGIADFVVECSRITRGTTFHMVPTSRSDKDEGWLKTTQSFFNNSIGWWMEQFSRDYTNVTHCSSLWNDSISVGTWFICSKGVALP